ncbi:rod-binding protein [Sulfitobacter sp.]|nr:rod-binding protein [Sulfitobacter sp.]|tara:strand:- start:1122 stop:1472 length:351 start_codon:yes stop_codon:yes gene_type:complete
MADIAGMSSGSFVMTKQRDAMRASAAWSHTPVDHSKSEKQQLYDVAKEFESIFLAEFLKQARQGELAEGMFSSEAGKTFQGMLDVEVARNSSAGINLGLAEAMVLQLGAGLSDKVK